MSTDDHNAEGCWAACCKGQCGQQGAEAPGAPSAHAWPQADAQWLRNLCLLKWEDREGQQNEVGSVTVGPAALFRP